LARKNAALAELDAELEQAPSSLRAAFALLERVAEQAAQIAASVTDAEEELKGWTQTLQRNCRDRLEDLLFLAPWLALPTFEVEFIKRLSSEAGRAVPCPPGEGHRKDMASPLPDGGQGTARPTLPHEPKSDAFEKLDQVPTLRALAMAEQSLCPLIEAALQDIPTEPAQTGNEEQKLLMELSRCAREAGDHTRQRLLALETLAAQSDEMAAMDFTFLFDPARDLFSTGFNVSERRCDNSFYDLLASEARLCSYVAIALGQVPQDHWFSMGRENGGQYTHAAIWTAMAFALMGESQRAWELFALLNPIHHGGTPRQIAAYKVEPYVVAADVYAVAPHTGRGGWTWYTGSAGWMYRLLIETLLGVNLEGDQLRLTPRLPKSWTICKIRYRYRQTVYPITITRLISDEMGADQLFLDGKELTAKAFPLVDDRREHSVELKVWTPRNTAEHRSALSPAIWPRPPGTAATVMPGEPALL
jgi:hypothetical protein